MRLRSCISRRLKGVSGEESAHSPGIALFAKFSQLDRDIDDIGRVPNTRRDLDSPLR